MNGSVDSSRHVRYAVRALLPPRPAPRRNRRLVAYFITIALSFLALVLGLNIMFSLGVDRAWTVGVSFAWFVFLFISAPVVFVLRARDGDLHRRAVGAWEADARRLAMERLGNDLTAGRLTAGMSQAHLTQLEAAASDWRMAADALDSIVGTSEDLGRVRDELRSRIDRAMADLLVEAGSGSSLGTSPFMLERARTLFTEIAHEAIALAQSRAPLGHVGTDSSLESVRRGLTHLRELRRAHTGVGAEDENTALRVDDRSR